VDRDVPALHRVECRLVLQTFRRAPAS